MTTAQLTATLIWIWLIIGVLYGAAFIRAIRKHFKKEK